VAQPEKVAAVAELSTRFRDASAALLTEYRGLTTAQLTELRRDLGSTTTYAVVKNTLTKRAAGDAGLAELGELLSGPTAIAFVQGDPVEAAKGLRDFARANPTLIIKGGVVDGTPLSAQEIGRLADLESREVLLGKLAGAMMANLSKAAGLFQAPLSQMARLAAALQEKLPADTAAADTAAADDTAAANAEAPTADATAADAAPAEAAADAAPTEAPTDTAG
jgi:large subunit ribosomal protein L10